MRHRPVQSIHVHVEPAAQYLRVLLDLFSGDVSLATAGYNAGENAVLRYKGIPPYKETQAYVPKVKAALAALGGGV